MANLTLDLYLDGTFIGNVRQNSHGRVGFTYDEAYRTGSSPTPLSLTMPTTQSTYTGKRIEMFLEGLLPDNENTRRRWAEEHRVNSNNPVALLTHVGRDAPGAVQVLPQGEESSDNARRTGNVRWLSERDFAELVISLHHQSHDWDPGQYGGQWSLPGAQSKIALHRDPAADRWGIPRDSTPTTHIIKPPMAGYPAHHINEALCMKTAGELGLQVASIDIVEEQDLHAVVVERYDRRPRDGRLVRLHQEDLCQALSHPPRRKYQAQGGPGMAEIGDLLSQFPEQDQRYSREAFFKAVVFNVLIGGTDAHAKNYSVLLAGDRARLAPVYDIASAAPYPQSQGLKSAMKVGGEWSMGKIGMRQWQKAAARLRIDPAQAVSWVEEMKAGLAGALDRVVRTLPSSTRDEAAQIAEKIDDHAQGRWKPSQERDPGSIYPPYVAPLREDQPGAPARGEGPSRS